MYAYEDKILRHLGVCLLAWLLVRLTTKGLTRKTVELKL
jgi:hypothetical protein